MSDTPAAMIRTNVRRFCSFPQPLILARCCVWQMPSCSSGDVPLSLCRPKLYHYHAVAFRLLQTMRLKTTMTEATTAATDEKISDVQVQIEKASKHLLSSAAKDIRSAIKAEQKEDEGENDEEVEEDDVEEEEQDFSKLMELLEKDRVAVLDALSLPKSLLHNRLIQSAKKNPSILVPSSEHQTDVQNVLNEIAPDWHATLQAGRVKPHFHALFLPEIFLGNRFSFDVVTAGEVDEERQPLEFDFLAKNLNEAIVADKNGIERGVSSIIDDGGVAFPWQFRPELAAFAAELVNTDATMLGEGIECTTLSSIPLELNPNDERAFSLLTRPESRGVVSHTFFGFMERPSGGLVKAITGLPGIGKSWTLFYALQQALLYDGANVLFFFQKKRIAVMYLRRNNKIYAWSSRTTEFAYSYLFERLDVLVLLDPTEADHGGANFALGKMKLLYAASNNEAHFVTAAGKNNYIHAYLGPPLDKELQVILSFLNPDLKPGDVNERKKNVGNLPRYILNNDQYMSRLKTTNKEVKRFANDPNLLKKVLEDDGMAALKGELSTPGTIFHVTPIRPDRLSSIGYDGQGVEYRNLALRASNDVVYRAILNGGRDMILSYFGRVSSDDHAKMGKAVEELFIRDLYNASGMVMKRYRQASKSKAKSKGGTTAGGIDQAQGEATETEEKGVESLLVFESNMKPLDEGIKLVDVPDEVFSKTDTVAKVIDGERLIDAAGPGRKVFQVTVSTKHGMVLDALKELCDKVGFIEDNKVVKKGTVDKLEFYWVVPFEIASIWKAKAPYAYRNVTNNEKEKHDKDLVNKCFERHIVQYVLPMTIEGPQPYDNKAT